MPKVSSRRESAPAKKTGAESRLEDNYDPQFNRFSLPPIAWVLFASGLAWVVLFSCFSAAQQDFPLNDDWAFGRGAMEFAAGEGIHYGNWASMPQLGQWLWACPFLWVLGRSFLALRVSTILLSWLGLWAFDDLLRQSGWRAVPAALATSTLAFGPLFFLLQGTFMTDVPALSLALAALALYVRALRREYFGWLISAALVAVVAAITRQNTLAAPLAVAVVLWRTPALRPRPAWWLGVLIPVAVGVAVHLWFQRRPDVRASEFALMPPASLLQLPFVALHFGGLMSLPLLLLSPRVENRKVFVWSLGLMLAFAGYWFLYGAYLPYNGLYPYTDNMLTPHGAFAGSKLSGGLLVAGVRPLLLHIPERVFLTALGCLAGAILVARAVHRWQPGSWSQPLILFALLQLPLMLLLKGIYDRYLLFLLPGFLFLAELSPSRESVSRRALFVGWSAVAVLALLSVGLMHDWLSWNTARWELGRRAVRERHIRPLDIEGGVEWDGWYASALAKPASKPAIQWPVLPFTREWFPSINGRYCLAFSELPGTRRVDQQMYTTWLPPGSRQFYLLEMPPLAAKPADQTPAR
jgi:hypothetical protein